MIVSQKYLCILFCVSSGQNAENLGCDECELVNLCYMLFDVKNRKTINTFEYLIRPVNKLNECFMSNECKLLSCLRENDLEVSFYLQDVVADFDQKINELGLNDFSLITDGSLHIRQALIPECTKKEIKLPHYYYSFFDIRNEFRKFAQIDQKINNLAEIENYFFIENQNFEGNYSNQQCKLIEKILIRLLESGHNLTQPEHVSKEFEYGSCHLEQNIQLNTIVRVRGLPWQVNEEEVHKFFSGLNICEGGIAICLSIQGRRNGEALIRFVNDEHQNLALRRHKHHIGQRYIEVYRASGKEFLNIIGGTNSEAKLFLSRNGKIIVRMRGLPFESNAKDVHNFFESGENSCHIVDGESGVLFVHYPDGRATGDAFVMFKDEEETNKALRKHKAMMGQRYIELFRSNPAEVQQVLKRYQDPKYYQNNVKNSQIIPLPVLPPELISGNLQDCIRLRNLPIECGVEQILEFLGVHSQHIVQQGCHMILNAQGQPSGEAFIQFDGELSSFNASNHKNGKCMYFGSKKYFIEVIQCSGEEMNLVLLGLLPSNLINMQQTALNNNSRNLNYNSYYLVNQPLINQQSNKSANDSTIQLTSQLFQTNTVLPNSNLASPLIPSQFIYYSLMPPVSPQSAVFMHQQQPPNLAGFTSYPYQHQQFNAKFNTCLLPAIEFSRLVLKGAPIHTTTFDIIEFLKDCGEILPESIQMQSFDGFQCEVFITCERTLAERIVIEKNHQKLGNNLIEFFFAI